MGSSSMSGFGGSGKGTTQSAGGKPPMWNGGMGGGFDPMQGGMMAYAPPSGGVSSGANPIMENMMAPARGPAPISYGGDAMPVAAGPQQPAGVPGGGVGVPMAGPGGVSSGATPITASSIMPAPPQQRVMGNAGNSVPGMMLRKMFGR